MERVAIFLGIWGLLTYLSGLPSFDERKRTLEGETDYFRARMLDLQSQISSTRIQRGKKRKREDAVSDWMEEGQKLVEKAEHLLKQIESWRCFFLGVKVRWDVCRLLYSLKVHDIKGNLLLRQALSDARGPYHGYHIPVNQLVGQAPSRTLDRLKLLLEGDKIGRIAIHGIIGIGKTFIMKHLHNWALNRFDYVFWVPSPVEFTVKCVQNAVAAVVHCDFSSDDALSVKAGKLSDTLAKLGNFVIFIDGVPNSNFSLEQVGIPFPAEGCKCKLVLSTSSSLECRMLDSFKAVEIKPLPTEDAYELFMQKANIGEGSANPLDGIPRVLANSCSGVPRLIEHISARMCGISDLREWRNAKFELVRKKKKLPPFPLGESEINSSHKTRSTRDSMK